MFLLESRLTVVSRKFMLSLLLSEVNLMVGCIKIFTKIS